MAASGKLNLKLSPDSVLQAEKHAQQQLLGVERTASQLLITVASRLHERLAASVSLKLASLDSSDPLRKGSHEFSSPLAPHSSDIPGLASEENVAGSRLSTSSVSVPQEFDGNESLGASGGSSSGISSLASSASGSGASGNTSLLNTWKGFPRNVSYYLPLISTLAGMVRKNTVSLLLHLMTEWLPQRHVLMSGGPAWELTTAALASSASATHSTSTPVSSTAASSLTGSSMSATGSDFGGSSSPLAHLLGEEDHITENYFSFTSFTGRIHNLRLSDQAQLDLVELVVLQVVADVLSLVLSSLHSSRIGIQTLEKLVQIAFTLVRTSQPRAIDEETWKVLQAPVQAQWSVVLGYLGPLMMPIFTTFMTISFTKLPLESQLILLERMRLPLYRADESNVVAFVMAALPHLIGTREKSTSVRLVQLDTLDRWLLACDMQTGGPLFEKIKEVFKRMVEQPSKNEELDGPINKLLSTILAHSPVSFRDKHIDVIMAKTWLKLAWSSKKRDYLECILRVLRGPFLDYHQPSGTVMFPAETLPGSLPTAVIYSPPGVVSSTTIQVYRPGGSLASKLGIKPSVLAQALPDVNPFAVNAPTPLTPRSTPSSMFELSWANHATLSPYAQCGFTGDREDKMLQRLITINSALFGQKNPLPRLGDQMDICAEIVVQIVAHHIKFGINSVLTPLVRGAVYNKMIALYALKRILDPASGFLQTAFCFQHAYDVPQTGESSDKSLSNSLPSVHVEDEDLKALQSLLVELVNESLIFTQKQLKEQRKEDALSPIALQPHAQICYADIEFLHELSSKQQLNTTATSAVKGCFERIRQLIMLGGPQTWLARQKEVDQHHLVVVDTLNKWMTASGIPLGYNAAEVASTTEESLSASTTIDKTNTEKKDASTMASAFTISVPLNTTGPSQAGNAWAGSGANAAASKKFALPFTFKRMKTTNTIAPEKFTLNDVAREAIGCLDLALASVHVLQPGDDLFVGNLILHSDEEIAQTCSLQLQQAMLTRPNLRPVIVKSLCTMATSLTTSSWALYAPSQTRSFTSSNGMLNAEPNNVLALLSHVLLFVDLWNLASLIKPKSSTKNAPVSTSSSDTPPPSLLDELDALAFICLASNVPMIRHTALSLANSLDALRETFGLPNRGVAWSIRQVETPMLQRARFAFLKETVQGVESRVVVKSDSMPLKMDMTACSHHQGFWPHVLAELATSLVDSPNTYQTVVASRFLVNQYTQVWKNVVSANGVALDYKTQTNHADFPSLYKNVHIIMFSTMSVPLYTTGGLPTTLSMFSKTAGWVPNTNTMYGHAPPSLTPTVVLSPVKESPLRRSMPSTQPQAGQGPTAFPTTSSPPQTTIDDVPIDAAALRHADERLSQVVAQSNNYIASLFKALSLEDHTMTSAIVFAASYVHWRSTLVVASHAWRWYQSLSSKPGLSKKRLKVRPSLASLFRRLMRHQTQFQWALRCPSPAWIFFIPPLTELSQSPSSGRTGGNSVLPLPPIYLHLQNAQKTVIGMPSHDSLLVMAQQSALSIEDGPVGPLLLLLPRIFYEFLADMAPNMISEHNKTSTFDAGQYFIDNATMLSRLTAALTDIPMVCCRTGALRQYLSPSQNRDAILTILASGSSAALLSVAASGGSSLGTSTGGRDHSGTISGGSAPFTDMNHPFGTISGGSGSAAAAMVAAASSPQGGHHHQRTFSVSTPSAKDTPPPIHINWAELTDMLLTWAPVGKAGLNRVAMDQVETLKITSRFKTRREERKTMAQFYVSNVSSAALMALNRLAQCGLSVPTSVVDKREVANKVLLDWVLPADRSHGLRFLRWLLASHLEVLLPVYIDRALGRERAPTSGDSKDSVAMAGKDSAMFIHAIYDQFLEDAASAPPDDGITHSTRVFFDRHFQLQKERLRYEKLALKRDDKEFTKTIIAQAGPLIFLVLLNLSHASALIRTRSFELLYRLGPIAFGLSHSLADYDLAKRFQDLRDAFISRMEGISRDRALEVAQLVSQSCHMFTEDLFIEAFARFKGLNSSNRSWVLHFLSCWTDRCILQPTKARAPVLSSDRDRTPWKHYSTDSLLHNLYTKLTSSADTTDKNYGRAPLLALWHGLSKAQGGVNLPAIVEYLLAKSVVSKNDLATCKLILLELYRAQSSAVCSLLVEKLTVNETVQNYKSWTSGNSKAYTLNSTMLTGLGIGVTAFDKPINTAAATASATAAPTITPKTLGKGLTREQSLSPHHMSQQNAQPVFEDVPVPDGTMANAAWSSITGKKSVQTKWSPAALMRDSIVSILADLLIEDVRPALPHLSVIFNYALLKFDSQVAHLLYSALVPIRTLLKDSDRKRAKDLIRTNGILDTLITLLKHSTFKMSWLCESASSSNTSTASSTNPQQQLQGQSKDSSGAPNLPSLPSFLGGLSAPSALNLTGGANPTIGAARHASGTIIYNQAQQQQHDALGPSLVEWAAAIKPGYLVNMMCQCAALLDQTTTKMDWANELIQWINQSVDAPSTDLAAATKALELCRAVLESSAASSKESRSHGGSEPNSPRSDSASSSRSSTKGGLYQEEDTGLLKVPQTVISSLQAAFLETLLFLERALRTSAHATWIATASLRDKQRHQENLTLLRARSEDMLTLLTLMVPHIEKSASLADLLFVGISVLRLSPVGFATFFEKGVLLVQAIVSDPRFQDVEATSSSSRLRRLLKGAISWDFPGLLPLALRGWYSQRTERSSGILMASIVESKLVNLVTPRLEALTTSTSKRGEEASGGPPSWLNSVLVIAGVLPWLHYSITSLNARKDDEFTASVSETCAMLVGIIEKACAKDSLLNGGDIVPASLMPIRNHLSALGNRQTNYGGYYDRAGEASRFTQEVLKKLVLLQNLYSPFCHAIGELLASLVIEAPPKLTESILFVHEALRSSAIPYLSERPASSLKSLDIRVLPRFTADAVGSIYKHMFELESNSLITEASFRIGGTPANDAQARSSILSIMNALHAYPSGWPTSLADRAEFAIESMSPRHRRGTVSSEEHNLDEINQQSLDNARRATTVHPLNRTPQMFAKLELTHAGGLRGAIDALRSTIAKPKKSKKSKHSSDSPLPSLGISPKSTGTVRKKGGKEQRSRHEKTKTSTSDPITPVGSTLKVASGTDRSGSATLRGENKDGMAHSQSSSSVSKDGGASAGFQQIQIHFERSPAGGRRPKSNSGISSGSSGGGTIGARGHRRTESEDSELDGSGFSDLEEEIRDITLTSNDFDQFRTALLDLEDIEDDDDDDDDEEDDESDDDLRDEFFKQFNLEGVNLAAFTSPRKSNATDDDGGVSDVASPLPSARGRKSKKHSRANSSTSEGDGDDTLALGLDLGSFEADSIERALMGLSRFEPELQPAEEEDDDEDSGSSSSGDDDDDDVDRTVSSARDTTPIAKRAGYNSEDAESEGSIESSEDRLRARKANKRMSVGNPTTTKPRERRAFKKRSSNQTESSATMAVAKKAIDMYSSSDEDEEKRPTIQKVAPRPPTGITRSPSGRSKSAAASTMPSSAISSAIAATSKTSSTAASNSNSGSTSSTASPSSTKKSSPTGRHSRTPSASPSTKASSSSSSSSSTSTASSSTAATSSATSSKSGGIARRIYGRGVSSAEISGAGMRKIVEDPSQVDKFLKWMKHNNLDSDVLSLVVSVKEFRSLTDESKRTSLAKRLIDSYFKPKRGLATLTEQIRSDTYAAFQDLNGKTPPTTLFDLAEVYCVDHLTKNHYVMFTKSPFHH